MNVPAKRVMPTKNLYYYSVQPSEQGEHLYCGFLAVKDGYPILLLMDVHWLGLN